MLCATLINALGDRPRLNMFSALADRALQTYKTWSVPYHQGVVLSKVVIFGNSGSGKSTLDLDTIAWKTSKTPERQTILESSQSINGFLSANSTWVIEGCYSDLLELVTQQADEVIFLNLPVSTCVANAKNRPWEPHKYKSKEAQEENLDMLIYWISQYTSRNDTFSKVAHEQLFEEFQGKKTMYVSNENRT